MTTTSTSPLRILFATGGSGGHLVPALAIAEAIRRRWPEADVPFVTTGRPIENDICRAAGVRQITLPLLPLAAATRRPLAFLSAASTSYRLARDQLRDERPAAVVGTGGWSMTPVIQAARRGKVPIVLCEQNVIPGRATRWLARRAGTVCVSFEETSSRLHNARRIVVTGNPVRPAIAALSDSPRSPDRIVLVLGGSQGARSLNRAVLSIVTTTPQLFAGWKLVHQTGSVEAAGELAAVCAQAGIEHDVSPFFSDMPQRYARAAIVISRAGATTLAELACAGVPAILVPYPHAADDHQRLNAEVFVAGGAARLAAEAESDSETSRKIAETFLTLTAEPARLAEMSAAMRKLARPSAAECVVDEIARLAGDMTS